jgi:hypothetical protein
LLLRKEESKRFHNASVSDFRSGSPAWPGSCSSRFQPG